MDRTEDVISSKGKTYQLGRLCASIVKMYPLEVFFSPVTLPLRAPFFRLHPLARYSSEFDYGLD